MVAGLLFLSDAVLVLLFALLGNRSHQTGLGPADVLSTAWPFLVGLGLGWLVTRSHAHTSQLWPAGVVVVVVTVAVGLVLRVLYTDGGAEFSFVLVAAATLGFFLLARRLLTAWVLPSV